MAETVTVIISQAYRLAQESGAFGKKPPIIGSESHVVSTIKCDGVPRAAEQFKMAEVSEVLCWIFNDFVGSDPHLVIFKMQNCSLKVLVNSNFGVWVQ